VTLFLAYFSTSSIMICRWYLRRPHLTRSDISIFDSRKRPKTGWFCSKILKKNHGTLWNPYSSPMCDLVTPWSILIIWMTPHVTYPLGVNFFCHFTGTFFVQKCFVQLFSGYILAFAKWFRQKKSLLYEKRTSKILMKLTIELIFWSGNDHRKTNHRLLSEPRKFGNSFRSSLLWTCDCHLSHDPTHRVLWNKFKCTTALLRQRKSRQYISDDIFCHPSSFRYFYVSKA
jgi:hypothetical protein